MAGGGASPEELQQLRVGLLEAAAALVQAAAAPPPPAADNEERPLSVALPRYLSADVQVIWPPGNGGAARSGRPEMIVGSSSPLTTCLPQSRLISSPTEYIVANVQFATGGPQAGSSDVKSTLFDSFSTGLCGWRDLQLRGKLTNQR